MADSETGRTGALSGNDWGRVLPGFFVSALALLALFYLIDFGQFINYLRLADYRLVLGVALVMLTWLAVRSLLWQTLLRGRAPYGQVLLTLNEGYLLNNLLPFRLGEVGRAVLLSRKSRLSFWEVLASIAIERSLDLACAVAVLIACLPFLAGVSWPRQAALAVGVVVTLILGGFYFVARQRERLEALYVRVSRGQPWLERLGGHAVPMLLEGLSVLTNGRRFLAAISLVVLNWLLAIGQYYLLVRAFVPPGSILMGAFILAVGALGIAAPSSPGALGVFEAAIVGALAVFKADPAAGLALALTAHLLQVFITGLLGAIALARDGKSLIGLYQQIRRIQRARA